MQFVEVTDQHAGQRLDNFLFLHMKGVPKGHVYKVIRRGEVRVNKGRVKNIYKLKIGDVVRIPPVRCASENDPPTISDGFLTLLKSRILFEDDGVMVVNKPSGVAVHGGSGLSFGLIEGVRALRPKADFLELVHRLDRETSGCLMIAKHRSSLRTLHTLFRSNQIQKTYTALLHGCIHRDEIKINAPLQKFVLQGGERMVRVNPEGKASETRFVVERRFKNSTLVKAYPKTGRTHQIRVHAQSMSHPIVGDERYCPTELHKSARSMGSKRLFLHASSLSYIDPDSETTVRYEAPLDDDLTNLLERLS